MKAKPVGLKYTDLCIYIDKTNYYRDENNNPTGLRELSDEESENIYTYLYHIIYALSVKKRMLTKKSDYDVFCIQAAGDIFMRLRKPDQDYTGQQKHMKCIKSILNYIKGALGFMCITWRETNYCQVITNNDPEDDMFDATKNFVRSQAYDQYSDKREQAYEDLITNLPKYFTKVVKMSILKKDKLASYELLVSLYLSLLNCTSLRKKQIDNYNQYKIKSKILTQLNDKNKFIITFSSNPIINKDFVDITLKKAFNLISDEYIEVLKYIEPTEEDINNILDSAYATYDMNQSGDF